MKIPQVGEIYVVYNNHFKTRKPGEEYIVTEVRINPKSYLGGSKIWVNYTRTKTVKDSDLFNRSNQCEVQEFYLVFKTISESEEEEML
jgi:hypothetical protein